MENDTINKIKLIFTFNNIFIVKIKLSKNLLEILVQEILARIHLKIYTECNNMLKAGKLIIFESSIKSR